MDQNFLDLLQCFERHKVKFLVIGGYAVSFHAEPRYTKDVDFLVECSKSNSRRLYSALDEFGAPLASVAKDDFAVPGTAYTAGLPPLRFDILNRIAGVDFKEAYSRRVSTHIGKTKVYYLALDDLINAKKAAGRPQDLTDAKKLMLVRKLKNKI